MPDLNLFYPVTVHLIPVCSLEMLLDLALLARSTYFQFQLVCQLRSYLELRDLAAVVTHAWVTSKLD